MSLSTLHSFSDWKKPSMEILDEAKSVKLSRGIGDGNWDGVVADYYATRGTLIPILNDRPEMPKTSTQSWTIKGMSKQEMFAWLAVKPKQDIGRGEAALYYWYNFTKKQPEIKKYAIGDLFDWTASLEARHGDKLKKFLASMKIRPSDLRSSGKLPSKKKMDVYIKFLASKEMVQLGQALGGQGRSLFMDRPYAAESKEGKDGPDLVIGRVPVEVKSYPSMTRQVAVGMVSDSGNFKPISLIGSLYGFFNLFHAFGSGGKEEPLNVRNVHAYDFPKALKAFNDVDQVLKKLGKDVQKFEVFKSLAKHMDDLKAELTTYGDHPNIKQKNLKSLIKKLDDESTRIEVAKIIAKAIILHKLQNKPGEKGFFFNSDPTGSIIWHIVEFEKISDEWDVIREVTLDNNRLMVNFSKLTTE